MSGPQTASVLDLLAQDARTMRTARMLPDTPLTSQQIDQVARDLKRHLREHRVSAESLSKQMGDGFSPARISQFLNGHQRGDMETAARRLNEWMEQDARRRESTKPSGFISTDVAERMLKVIYMAHHTSGIGEIVGPAGVGKTMTLKAAASMIPGAIYHRVTQSERRPTGLVCRLCDRLRVPIRSGAISRNMHLLIQHLEGTGRLMLIDEAHQLMPQAIEALRDLHDETKCAVVLAGTYDLHRTLSDTSAFYGQLSSRVVARINITELMTSPRRGRKLFTTDEITACFSGARLRLTDDGARYIAAIANVPGMGGLRLADKVIAFAARLKQTQGKPIDAATAEAVLRQMHGDAWVRLSRDRAPAARAANGTLAAGAGAASARSAHEEAA